MNFDRKRPRQSVRSQGAGYDAFHASVAEVAKLSLYGGIEVVARFFGDNIDRASDGVFAE